MGAQEQQRSYKELQRSTGSVNMQSGKICAYLGADVTDQARAGLPVVAPPTGGDWHERAPDLANMLVAVCVCYLRVLQKHAAWSFSGRNTFL